MISGKQGKRVTRRSYRFYGIGWLILLLMWLGSSGAASPLYQDKKQSPQRLISEHLGVLDFRQDKTRLPIRKDVSKVKLVVAPTFFSGLKLPRSLPARTVDVKAAEEALSALRPLVSVSVEVGTGTLQCEILPRDYSPSDRDTTVAAIREAFRRRGDGPLTLAIRHVEAKDGVVRDINDQEGLENEARKFFDALGHKRILVADGLLGLSTGPSNDKVMELQSLAISERGKALQASTAEFVPEEKFAAQGLKVASEGKGLFLYLHERQLMDDRLTLYEETWAHSIAPALSNKNMLVAGKAWSSSFTADLTKADAGKCTAYVVSLPNAGAEIRYALPADAATNTFSDGGVTPRPVEVPRDFLIFALFRNGRETKRTGRVDCTVPHRMVDIKEE